jgi:alkylated DNA repair dioxygenase AlkB
MGAITGQRSLFGHEEPRIDLDFRSVERIELDDGAWIEIARGWLDGHAAVFDELERTTEWRSESRVMYDKRVDVPRLHAVLSPEQRPPAIQRMRAALEARYDEVFERVSVALYRDGKDSVAWHGDYVAREMLEPTIVATVSVGEPRKFWLRPTDGGRSMAWSLGWGDLFVMGGTCQRTYRHAIPKVAIAGPRIAIMFRPTWSK